MGNAPAARRRVGSGVLEDREQSLQLLRGDLAAVLVELGALVAQEEVEDVVAEALGEHVFDFFLRNKRAEWANYRSQVTPFELKTYLSL